MRIRSEDGGLVWHTQGSGKTFTLITAARMILEDKARFSGATVMLVVDRNELEGQLKGWVEAIVGEMQRRKSRSWRATRRTGCRSCCKIDFRGLIISMIHKFEGVGRRAARARNFFVLIDEAHRSVARTSATTLWGRCRTRPSSALPERRSLRRPTARARSKSSATRTSSGYLDKYSIQRVDRGRHDRDATPHARAERDAAAERDPGEGVPLAGRGRGRQRRGRTEQGARPRSHAEDVAESRRTGRACR